MNTITDTLSHLTYDQRAAVAKRWGKLHGYTGAQGGFIYNAKNKAVTQGWQSFFNIMRRRIVADLAAGKFKLTAAQQPPTLKARVDAGEIVHAGHCSLQLGVNCSTGIDVEVYVMGGRTGEHHLNVATTDNARLVAHWQGYVENNQAFAEGRIWRRGV